MDWTDEVRVRLVREEERLRYKAANLQARGKTVMAAQELVVADDIRSALGEIESLQRQLAEMLVNATLQWQAGQEHLKRAESAEAVLDIASREIDRLTKKAESAEAEVERLKGLLTKVMGRVQHRSPQLAREIIGSVSEDAEFRAALRGGGE